MKKLFQPGPDRRTPEEKYKYLEMAYLNMFVGGMLANSILLFGDYKKTSRIVVAALFVLWVGLSQWYGRKTRQAAGNVERKAK